MKRYISWFNICALVIAGLLFPIDGRGQGVTFTEASTNQDGVVIVVRFPNAASWSNATLFLSISNTSAKTVMWHDVSNLGGFRFALSGLESTGVTYTLRGKQFLSDEMFRADSYHGGDIGPGSGRKIEVLLSDYFQIAETGTYRLTVTWNSDIENNKSIHEGTNIYMEIIELPLEISSF